MKLANRCPSCGRELCSGDYGYYCDNQECPEYDKDIEVYGEEEPDEVS